MNKRILELRKTANLTQNQVSQILHCSQTTYRNYELGKTKIPIRAIIILSELYNTSVDYIIGITDERLPHKPKKSAL